MLILSRRSVRCWISLALVLALLLPASSACPVSASPGGTRLVVLSRLDGPALPPGLTIVQDYGSFVLARVSDAQLAALPEANIADRLDDRTVISLNGRVWDSARGEPSIPPGLRAAASDPYFLVQFQGPIATEWRESLLSLGAVILGYHPNYTYLVRMAPPLLPRAQALPGVQWVGRYHPAYRLASDDEFAIAPVDNGRLAVEVITFESEDTASLTARIAATGAGVILIENDPPVARVWAARDQLAALATLANVYRVEPYDPPRLLNDGAAQVMTTWNLRQASRNGLLQDLMGAGQTVGLVDSGLDNKTTSPNIEDFFDYTGGTTTSRVVYNANSAGCTVLCACTATDDSSNGGHGTHVAGTMVGNGYLSLLQRGLTAFAVAADPSFDYGFAVGQAPEARIGVVHTSASGGGLCISAQTDWTTLYNQGARAVNNSWGNSTTTYGGNARTADYVMWTYQDYLIVASAGNAGPGPYTVSQPATAKNILAVGASGNHRSVWSPDSDTASLLTDFSSRGPITTGDTRFKPDIVAPGADVLSTRTTYIDNATVGLWQNEPGDGDEDGHLDYAWSGGTSMSSPQVTGAAIIVRDYYQDIQGLSNATPPSAALLKATLLNGAVDMGYGYEANTAAPYGGRNAQGWGMANLEQSLTPLAPRSFFYDDFTNITNATHQSTIGLDSSGDYVQYTVTVVDSGEPLKVTLTWTDFSNTGSSSYAVNNLNLLVTPPSGSPYYGNSFTGAWSNNTATYDAVNNTEAVYVRNPAVGTWTVRVTLANAPTGTRQPYALVVSGGLGVTPSTSRTCYGLPSCTGRMGTSAQPYFPSLKPLSGSAEHVQAGSTSATRLRLTNWGTNADTISLSAAATTLTGSAASGFSVSFSPAGPYALASGASVDVSAVITVSSGVANGSYDLTITAASSAGSPRQDQRVLAFNVLPAASLPNEARIDSNRSVVSVTGAQVGPAFWACPTAPTTVWTAYLDASSHSNGPAAVYAARSTDGGVTWTRWQLNDSQGDHNSSPAIAGSADCSSVTVAWVRETSSSGTPQYNYYLHSRTYSGGAWGTIGTRDSLLNNASYLMADPAVIYDRDSADTPDILLVWLHYTGTGSTTGIYYSLSTNNGSTWSTAAGAVTGGTHRYPALTIDTVNNHVWMAFRYSGTTSDIYVKYWNGSTNAWNATNTAVAATANRENHPAIHYASGRLWVAWNRYTDYANATPLLYYTYSTSTLPTLTWAATQGPYGTRLAEHTPPALTGDNSFTYLAYLAYNDSFRGGNIYALKLNAATGALDTTYQLTSTADDPPLASRGNAGGFRLAWATTNLNNTGLFSGPTLLYAKPIPWADSLSASYSAGLGTAQALFNESEDVDLWLAQVGTSGTTAVVLDRFEALNCDGAVWLGWETSSEVSTLGFFLYRYDPATGERMLVNEAIVPALFGSAAGGIYRLLDPDARPDSSLTYELVEIEARGGTATYGPFAVTASRSLPASGAAPDGLERLHRPADLPRAPALPEPTTSGAPSALPPASEARPGPELDPGAPDAVPGDASASAAPVAARLTLRGTGLYFVSAADIAAALNLSPAQAQKAIKTGGLQLANRGVDVSWLAAADNAGLYFHGQAARSLFAADNVYWLQKGVGKRMASRSNRIPSPVAPATFAATSRTDPAELAALGMFSAPTADYWVSLPLVGGSAALGSRTFGLRSDGAAGTGQATLTVRLLGLSSTRSGRDHHVRLSLNGTVIGETAWSGAVGHEATFAVDPTLLSDGDNAVQVLALLDNALPYSILCLDSLELTYQRWYRALDGALTFPAPRSGSAVTVDGFSSPNILVLNLADPLAPRRLSSVRVEPWDGAYRATFQPDDASAAYLAIAAEVIPRLTTLTPDVPSSLRTRNGAHYVIITTAALAGPAADLAAYRASQGLVTRVVDVQDIFDEFSFGLPDPAAIRAFLSYAWSRWSPRPAYVLLAGAGSYDYRNDLGYGDCLVPPVLTGALGVLVPADGLYADVADNDASPELALGRLPVLTAAEFQAHIDKIRAYEAADPAGWSRQVVLLADNADPRAGDFAAASDLLAGLLPAEFTAQRLYLGKPLSTDAARAATLAALQSGVGLFHFVGHSGLNTLAGEQLLTSSQVPGLTNAPRLPLMAAATCVVGDYATPGYRSLGVLLTLAGNGGMAGVLAPTGPALNSDSSALSDKLFAALGDGRLIRVGDLTRAALVGYAADSRPRYIGETYNLIGDPAALLPWGR